MVGLNGTSRATAALYALSSASAALGIDVLQLAHQLLERVRGHLGDLLDPVLVAQQVRTLASKICQANWPGWFRITRPYLA